MKRIVFFLILCFTGFGLTGCLNISATGVLKNNIAEVVFNQFAALDANYKITLETGRRENPYQKDGKAESLTDFCVITAKPRKRSYEGKTPSYQITIDGKAYTGKFETSPFNASNAADLKMIVSKDAVITLTVTLEKESFDYTLQNVFTAKDCTYTEVMQVAQKAFADDIKKLTKNGKFYGEFYIRIIGDVLFNANTSLWFVGMCTTEGKESGIVINPTTRDIIAKS